MLVTIGEDEAVPLSTISLKIFDLDKTVGEGTSTTGPSCVRSLQVFTDKYPEAKVCLFKILYATRSKFRHFQLNVYSCYTADNFFFGI
jgi:hypothetical protein